MTLDLEVSQKKKQVEEQKNFIPKKDIVAEIIEFKVYNGRKQEIDTVCYDEKVQVWVTYDVYDDLLSSPVLGIAIRGCDDKYINGLNTLLDKKNIPWKYGRNRVVLEYPYGILALGGKYYFDVALFEQTATVPIEYIAKIKEITIVADYEGEGVYIMPHTWRSVVDE